MDVDGCVLMLGWGFRGFVGLMLGVCVVVKVVWVGLNLFGELVLVMMCCDVFECVGGWSVEFLYFIDQVMYFCVLFMGEFVLDMIVGVMFCLLDLQWSVVFIVLQVDQVCCFYVDFYCWYFVVVFCVDVLIGNVCVSVMVCFWCFFYFVFRWRS